MSSRTGIVLDHAYVEHELPGHVERPDRVRSIALALCDSGLEARVKYVPARRATKAEICLAHSPQVRVGGLVFQFTALHCFTTASTHCNSHLHNRNSC